MKRPPIAGLKQNTHPGNLSLVIRRQVFVPACAFFLYSLSGRTFLPA
jgi:hypothetical protein